MVFTTSAAASPFLTAIPAESYPLYSNLDKPYNNIGADCFLPTNPTIPHMIFSPNVFSMCILYESMGYSNGKSIQKSLIMVQLVFLMLMKHNITWT